MSKKFYREQEGFQSTTNPLNETIKAFSTLSHKLSDPKQVEQRPGISHRQEVEPPSPIQLPKTLAPQKSIAQTCQTEYSPKLGTMSDPPRPKSPEVSDCHSLYPMAQWLARIHEPV